MMHHSFSLLPRSEVLADITPRTAQLLCFSENLHGVSWSRKLFLLARCGVGCFGFRVLRRFGLCLFPGAWYGKANEPRTIFAGTSEPIPALPTKHHLDPPSHRTSSTLLHSNRDWASASSRRTQVLHPKGLGYPCLVLPCWRILFSSPYLQPCR